MDRLENKSQGNLPDGKLVVTILNEIKRWTIGNDKKLVV